MNFRFNSLFSLALVVILLGLLFRITPATAADLQTGFNAKGLATIRYGGVTLLDTNAHGDDAFWLFDVDGPPTARDFDAASRTLTWTYRWGRVACQYTQRGEQLDLDIRIQNDSAQEIGGFNLFPLALRFPGFPKEYDADTPHVRFNDDGPTIQSADFGSGIVSVINRDAQRTLAVGLTTTSETGRDFRYNVYIGSTRLWYQPNNWPTFNRPVAAGGSDNYQISLRFSPPGTPAAQIAADVNAQYAQAHPFELKWDDRRPIASLFLSSAGDHPARNPRGWFNNDARVDVTTDAGRAQFRQSVLEYADRSVEQLKSVGAQGMVTWDIEGQEHPHSISYIGDPRLCGQLAPEMESIADAYFARFRAAGLRVGVCVRPQKLRLANGGADQLIVADEAAELIARVQYAKTRWGATLFYVDSNGGPYDPSNAEVFRRVARAHPDVLLMPEHENLAYYSHTAPYNHSDSNPSFTSDEVRRLYPQAFSVVKIMNVHPTDVARAAMVAAVRAGDILMFNGWFNSEDSHLARDIYAEAWGDQAPAELTVTTTLDVVAANDGLTSLREAIIAANNADGHSEIGFAPGVRGVITLNGSALPLLKGEVTISGPGARVLSVNARGRSGIFRIARGAQVEVSGLTLIGGNAGGEVGYNGGAINNEGDLTVRASYLRGNRGNAGGAICSSGDLTIEGCTFASNLANHVGGAIFGVGGTLSLWQSTFVGNAASAVGGGAVCANSVKLKVESCTIAANRAPEGRSGIWFQGGVLTLHNTILAGNRTRDLQFDGGSIDSGGYNLIGRQTGLQNYAWKTSDKFGLALGLVALTDNGGATPTCALLASSAAIDAGNPALRGTDQRGFNRASGGRADIGAFEAQIVKAPASQNPAPSSNSS